MVWGGFVRASGLGGGAAGSTPIPGRRLRRPGMGVELVNGLRGLRCDVTAMSVACPQGNRVCGSLPYGYGLALAGHDDAAIQPLLDLHTGTSIADALHVRQEL